MLDSLEFDEGFLDVVETLRKRYALGILSNLPAPWGRYLVKKYYLNRYFDPIVFSGEWDAQKPDGALYADFMDLSSVRPKNSFFVDDDLGNLKEGEFLGMHTVHIKREDKTIEFKPEYTIKSLSELAKIL